MAYKFDGVTLFVDAAYDYTKNASGYGAWYRHCDMPNGEFIGSQIYETCLNASEAELIAIRYALEHLRDKNLLIFERSVIIQSDNLRALGLILQMENVDVQEASKVHAKDSNIQSLHNSVKSPLEQNILQALDTLLKANSTKVFVRHIKGHQVVKAGRSWVNDRCDVIAKKNLVIAQRRIGGKVS